MTGRKRTTRTAAKSAFAAERPTSDVYGEMLEEALTAGSAHEELALERPLKRPRPNTLASKPRGKLGPISLESKDITGDDDGDRCDRDTYELPPPATVQTLYEEVGNSDDEDEDADVEFENVIIDSIPNPTSISSGSNVPTTIELDLSKHHYTTSAASNKPRRNPISKETKARRLNIHKVHLLCLLWHCSLRNYWCNDDAIQSTLHPLLSAKMMKYLNPSTRLSQFGKTESLKIGLQQVNAMFRSKFEVTECGMRRARWTNSPESLSSYEPLSNLGTCLDRNEFIEAAKSLRGSRDVGAQLYCALLRSAGVEARLVCSLQALCPGLEGPLLPITGSKTAKHQFSGIGSAPSSMSHFPVYWVEILDVGHQQWQPTDPIVTGSFWKPSVLEPPASDQENRLAYVVALNADGSIKDVTRRYAKAYAAKTRKLRVEAFETRGSQWWRKALRRYRSRVDPETGDLDQIEDAELAAYEAREPMPRNVADFKDHPIYALDRHLRRSEVLAPNAQQVGTIGVGPHGGLERIYRRSDVRIARSRDKWYHMGRTVRPGSKPVKILASQCSNSQTKSMIRGNKLDHDDETPVSSISGTPLFTVEQTVLYEPEPVSNGRIPKNKFGNIEIYVPSMVPPGSVHIRGSGAARAAFTVGVDYAPALTGFTFKGRHGTAILDGVVVASEYSDAVRTVMEGIEHLETEAEQKRRNLIVLKMWRRFLVSLRIYDRVWAGAEDERHAPTVEWGDRDEPVEVGHRDEGSVISDGGNGGSDVIFEDRGGGFIVDRDDDEGGFLL